MNLRHTLSRPQREFLRHLPNHHGSLQAYLTSRNILTHRFQRWMNNRAFKKLFYSAMNLASQFGELNLQNASQTASMKLSGMKKDRGNDKVYQEFKALIETIKVAHQHRVGRKSIRPTKLKQPPQLGPDLSDERSQRLFRKLVDAHFEEVDKTAK